MTTPELLAIRWTTLLASVKVRGDIGGVRTGHSSAASFPTGPVMAEPFISPLGLTIYSSQHTIRQNPTTSLQDPHLHLLLFSHPGIHQGRTHNTGVVLKVQEDTVEPLPGLRLPDDDGGVHLLPELGLSLLDRRHDHVADAARGHAVEARAGALNRDDVQVPGAGVVGAVHDGADGETEGHLELAAGGTATGVLR